jgi:hypothetical protein
MVTSLFSTALISNQIQLKKLIQKFSNKTFTKVLSVLVLLCFGVLANGRVWGQYCMTPTATVTFIVYTV